MNDRNPDQGIETSPSPTARSTNSGSVNDRNPDQGIETPNSFSASALMA